jgi:hypothetical protein
LCRGCRDRFAAVGELDRSLAFRERLVYRHAGPEPAELALENADLLIVRFQRLKYERGVA